MTHSLDFLPEKENSREGSQPLSTQDPGVKVDTGNTQNTQSLGPRPLLEPDTTVTRPGVNTTVTRPGVNTTVNRTGENTTVTRPGENTKDVS